MTVRTHASVTPRRSFRGVNILGWLLALDATARQRHALGRLDGHLLKDVGLDRESAKTEAQRAPWDVPSHWRR